jgi:two-component system cell cycle response regulator DivK
MKKIFILDDNEELLEIMQRLLSHDYQVECRADSDNIIEEISNFSPDLLLLDHSVGEMNSGDILGKLKSGGKPFTTPVVLFSAHPLLSDMANLIGADGFIDKPSDINYIRTYIKEILGRD